jgi:hypothetical protein
MMGPGRAWEAWWLAWTLLIVGAMTGTMMIVTGMFNELTGIIRDTRQRIEHSRSETQARRLGSRPPKD